MAIDTCLNLVLELEPVGSPVITVLINNKVQHHSTLSESVIINNYLELLDPFTIDIVLSNKHYTVEYETAVIINKLAIDNINLVPQYNYLANYQNDHNNNNPTNYLGFNGKWTLTIDRPFYQWLHQVSGQGWLLS
jgi:hypothetical protein